MCKKYMCLFVKHNWTGGKCAFMFHSEKYFGWMLSERVGMRMELERIMKISKGNLLIGNGQVTLP